MSYDALALLVVRLRDPAPADGPLHWYPWNAIADAQPHGIARERLRAAHEEQPHKRLPGGEAPYFGPHVERLLFPSGDDDASGGRWLCEPRELWLGAARIDLLERYDPPLARGGSIGLVHLSLSGAGAPEWAAELRTLQRRPDGRAAPPVLRGELGDHALDGARSPMRALVEQLFGDPAGDLERRLFRVLLAAEPDGAGPAELDAWRRAVERGRPAHPHERAEPLRTSALGPLRAVVRGPSVAVFGQRAVVGGESARNLRSYWGESLLVGLVQHDALESFATRLAELGVDPSRGALDTLHEEWLAFRNVLWWSQLATSSSAPQMLLGLLRQARGTERLFRDLEEDFSAYVERRRWLLEDRKQRALENLQVYGAATATAGALAAIIALTRSDGRPLAALIAVTLVAAVGVGAFVRYELRKARGG